MKTVRSIALALAAAAPPALAFRPASSTARRATAVRNTLRDMAAYPDDARMMFDSPGGGGQRFSRSPQGRPDAAAWDARQPGGPGDRMYTMDGFDPYSAYGGFYGGGGGGGGPDGTMMMRNRVKPDDTMGGFSYDSRNRRDFGGEFGPGGPSPYGYEGPSPYGYEGGMFDGPPPMDYDDGYPEDGYGGFDGDMSRMGP